jgi:poly(3-hydroxybutyrate) depolymerase
MRAVTPRGDSRAGPLLPNALRDPTLAALLASHRGRQSATAFNSSASKLPYQGNAQPQVPTSPGGGSEGRGNVNSTGHGARDNVVLLLDYDGTLAPIVSDPAQAQLAKGMVPVLRACATASAAGIRTIVISGR